MQIIVIIFLTLITIFEFIFYKSTIKSLKSYVGYYKFIKNNNSIKFKNDEKISIINSINKIVKTSSNSFIVSIAILIFILYLNISGTVNILLILLFILSILKYIKIKKQGNYAYNYYKNQL
ncbi:hypothetical protein [Aliarcobacter cryaerophilus]|uniref:hypothetical protein n=1 Tax=Aliarcobacter cryaerophilus TaxID=28198 RepID=UPI00082F40CA|nr:hypothetical protein [Aliarcobacter cryaerophilus]